MLSNIIDVHSHPMLPIGEGIPADRAPVWTAEAAVNYMDQHGIAACMLSIPDSANHAQGTQARDYARRTNDALAEIVARYPARFGALATLPGRNPDECLVEMEHALDVLKLDGVATSSSIDDTYLGEPCFDPWFEEMHRRGTTLFIHPGMTRASAALTIGLNVSVLEFMFDTTRMLVNMVVTGAKRRFSGINMISCHGGGTIPYLVNRIGTLQHTFGVGPGRLEMSAEELQAGFASFYYDLTAATSSAQLQPILELVPTSQLLVGLDYPLMPANSYRPALEDLANCPDLNADDRAAIAWGNAQRLFPALHDRMISAGKYMRV